MKMNQVITHTPLITSNFDKMRLSSQCEPSLILGILGEVVIDNGYFFDDCFVERCRKLQNQPRKNNQNITTGEENMMIRRAFSSGVRSQFRTTPSVFGALNSVRFIAVDKEIDKKKIVERFLEDKEHSGEDYLGIHIVEDDHYANAKTEKHVKNVISSFSLSDKVPGKCFFVHNKPLFHSQLSLVVFEIN